MAAVTFPMSPVARQPFAVLGEARLRAVNSIKNQQNNLTATSLKRRLDISEDDSENIDPLLMASLSKRNKSKHDTGDNIQIFTKPISTFKSPAKARSSVSAATTPARPIRGQTSLSAPLRAPAGRSPKAKTKGVNAFGRRSGGYRRVDPPSFPKRNMSRVPFSIADALNGTFTASKPAMEPLVMNNIKSRRPKAWEFEIHADTEQDEMANLMEHSTCVLDISDDEEKRARDNRGKENIPPPPLFFEGNIEPATTQQAATVTQDINMAQGPRSPLGELDVKSFVPEGEDITSVIEVLDDDESPAEETPAPVEQTPGTISKEPSQPAQEELLAHSQISTLLARTVPEPPAKETAQDNKAEIEIWESASAAEEDLKAAAEADC